MKTENNATPKERPILFSGEMVRAILDGRKTMTRRVHKLPSGFVWADESKGEVEPKKNAGIGESYSIDQFHSPYGNVGDRLWVRETWVQPECERGQCPVYYRADARAVSILGEGQKWRPSIFMPRWASRILLEITAVHIERLMDISEADAKAEGVRPLYFGNNPQEFFTDSFQQLWDSINASRGFRFDSNPWVWVIEFKRVDV